GVAGVRSWRWLKVCPAVRSPRRSTGPLPCTGNRARSRWITARSSPRERLMNGLIAMGLRSTSSGRESLWRTVLSSRSTESCATNVLNANEFLSIEDARCKIEAWRVDYNLHRPHTSLGQLSPAEFLRRSMTEAEKPLFLRPRCPRTGPGSASEGQPCETLTKPEALPRFCGLRAPRGPT